MSQPSAAMLVIGDEILSGRTRDINAHELAMALNAHGIALKEVRFVGDTPSQIIDAVNALRSAFDHVFTSGGIGPTHDDITADCVAKAFGRAIDVRDDARAILEAHYAGTEFALNAARLRMARIPEGATLIDNPVSRAPGFQLGNVYVMAGVPRIFKAMLDGVLASLEKGQKTEAVQLRIERPEGEIAGPLGRFAKEHPDLAIGCYPFNENGVFGCNIVLRGPDLERLEGALSELDVSLRSADEASGST